jgi:hypothetical protein
MFALPDEVTNLDCMTTHWVNNTNTIPVKLHLMIYLEFQFFLRFELLQKSEQC